MPLLMGAWHTAVCITFVNFELRGRARSWHASSPTLWLSELEIEDVSADQLEGISFRAKDFGGGFEVSCAEVLIAIDG
jgi:hypothetical protein